MRDAGLTHGGFYKHFGSKDDLLTQSLSEAFQEIADRLTLSCEKVPTGDGVEGDCKVLPEPGTLRSRRVRVPVGGTCARVGTGRPCSEGPDRLGADQIQKSNTSLDAGPTGC